MKIRVFGFTWETTPTDKMESFLEYVQSLNKVEIQSLNAIHPDSNYHRTLIVTRLDNELWGGLMLTVKTAKKYISSLRTGRGYRITTKAIANNENLVDTNFFIFNPKTGAGLYQYYHLSAYLNTFNRTFAEKFKEHRAIEKFKGKFTYSEYLTPSDFATRISNLEAIHHVEYELSTIGIPQNNMVPMSGLVARERIKVFYKSGFYRSPELKDGLIAYLTDNLPSLARFFVKGKDSSNRDVNYSYFDDPSTLSQQEFNDFEVDLEINENIEASLKSSSNLEQLVTISNVPFVKTFFYTKSVT